MKRNRKYLFGSVLLLLSSVFALGHINGVSNNNQVETKAEESLPYNKFNAIAGGWNPNADDLDRGYCHYVFEFKYEWGTAADKSDANLCNTVVGENTFINGVKFSEIGDPNAKISYGHGGKYLAIKVKKELVVPATNKTVCEIHINDGTPFFNYLIPKFNVEINCLTYAATVVKEPEITGNIKVDWRNTVWGTHDNLLEKEYEPNPVIDGNTVHPANGYLALVTCDPKNDNSKFSDEQNFAYDPNYEFSTKMRINGVQVKDIEGVKVNGILGYLYFYIYEPTIPNKDLYEYPTVEFASGIRMGDIIFPKMTFQYIGKLGKSGDWKMIKASNKGIVWNKENKNPEIFGNKKGLLVGLDRAIYEGTSENLLDVFGNTTKLNNISFSSLTNAEIRIYDSTNLWFYADEMNQLNEAINILEFSAIEYNGEPVDGFKYYCQNGDNSYWSSRTSNDKQQLTFYYDEGHDFWGSKWASGHVYMGDNTDAYCGGTYVSGTKEGFLLSFNEKFSKLSDEYGGQLKYINLVKENIGHHIYSKGVPLCDIEGAEIMYHSEGNLWIWEPNMTEPYDGKNYAEVSIDGGTLFFDSEFPEIHIFHEDYKDLSNLTQGNSWRIQGCGGYEGPKGDCNERYITLDEDTPDLNTWLGPFSWNNHDGDGTVLFCYGHNPGDIGAQEAGITEPTYLRDDKQPDFTNLASKDFAIGWKLKFNGTPIWKITDAKVSYQNGENYFTVVIPNKYAIGFNGYKVPTLTLDDHTNFHDVSLQGFEVYFNSAKLWQKEPIASVSDEELESAINYSDVFNTSLFNNEIYEVEGTKSVSKNEFAFEFVSDDSTAAFALNLFGKDKNHSLGVVLDLSSKTLIASDNTGLSKQIGAGAYPFEYVTNEWSRFYIKADIEGQILHMVIAIDDIIVADIDNVELGNVENIGDVMYLYTNQTNIEFHDIRLESTIKRPLIVYSGKNLYRFYEGEKMPDLLPLFSATDMLNDISSSIKLEYEEGMLNSDKTLNKGSFVVKAIATSKVGISAVKEIKVIVTLPNEVVVTFDGENPTTYSVGDYIQKPANPTKPSQDGTEFEFAYWEYNNEEWDFENSYVTQDMNLTSKFTSSSKEYSVQFNIEGLDSNYTLDFRYILGAEIDFNFLNKNGYTFEVFDGENPITSLIVSGDHVLTVKYTKNSVPDPTPDPIPDPSPKKGCKSSIVATSIVSSIVAFASLICISLRKKEEK